MILDPQATFSEWVLYMRKKLKIKDESSSLEKTGIYLFTLKSWERNKTLPQCRTLIKISSKLAQTTGESPQDILDTIMESIPEWRIANGK